MNHSLTLDPQDVTKNTKITFTQGDALTNIFIFTLNNYIFNEGDFVKIFFKKPDNTFVQNTGTINEDGTISCTLGTQEIAAIGTVKAQLKVYSEDHTEIFTSNDFYFLVKENLDNDLAVQSTTSYPTLIELISDVEDLQAAYEELNPAFAEHLEDTENPHSVTLAQVGGEPSITKSTGYMTWNGTAWVFKNETYSLSNHNHDLAYAAIGHNHDLLYASLGHNHDLTYAPIAHTHADKADLVGGTVPASQLPSYVDDVLEYANFAGLPVAGETGKIYVTLDTNLTYRWSGTQYTEISVSLALGETSSTAYRGDRGKTAYDHSQTTGNPHGATLANVGIGSLTQYSIPVVGATYLENSPLSYNANLYYTKDDIRAVSTIGLAFINNTPATLAIPVQKPTYILQQGTAWDTDGSSDTWKGSIRFTPVSGSTTSGKWEFVSQKNSDAETTPIYITTGGNIYSSGNVYTYNLINRDSANYGRFYLGTDVVSSYISRAMSDAFSVLAINNASSTSTGHTLDLQSEGVTNIYFTKLGMMNLPTTTSTAGQILINGVRYFHAYSDPTSNGKNLFIGEMAGNFTLAKTGSNTYEASKNTGIGYYTFNALTTGYYNTSLGYGTGQNLTTGMNNTFVGYQTGNSLTTGESNMAIGRYALATNITGSYNTAIGTNSLYVSTVSNLVAIGYDTLASNTTGTGHVSIGYQAGKYNVKGTNNTYLGYQAGYSGTTVVSSITITNGGTGYTAGNLIVDNAGTGGSGLTGTYTVDGSGTILVITITNNGSGYNTAPVVTPQPGGSNAVLTPVFQSSENNIAIGYGSMYATSWGYANASVGTSAMYNNTGGASNSCLGTFTLYANTIGSQNVAMGRSSGRNNTTGSNNIYIGYESAYKSGVTATGSGNVFMGYQTGINNTASNNVFIGYQAGKTNTNGDGLVGIGYLSLANSTGSENTACGYNSGASITTGYYNAFLGKSAGSNASQKVDAVNSMALGYGAYTTESNSTVIGNSSMAKIITLGTACTLGDSTHYFTEVYSTKHYFNSTAILDGTTAGQINCNADFEIASTKAFYLGEENVDGTWRIVRSGNNLVMERRESGSYVTKQTITA